MQANTVTTTEDYFPPVAGRNYVEYSHATLFLHTNPLGSVGTTTDADGNWTSSEIYDPWGQRWGYTGTLYAERFADLHKRDAESGLDPTQNRMFTSSYGRWLSPDPLAGDITNPQSLNRYAYVMNNPLSFIDPMGLGPLCTWDESDCEAGYDPCAGTGWMSHAECPGPSSGGAGIWWYPGPSSGGGGAASGGGGDTTGGTQETISESVSKCGGTIVFGGDCPFPYGTEVNGVPGGLGYPGGGFGMPCDFGTCGPIWNQWTGQINGSISVNFWFFTFSYAGGFAVDLHGHIASFTVTGKGVSQGGSGSIGLQGGISNAHTVCGLGGPFWNASGSFGAGGDVSADIFQGKGDGPNGTVTGGGITVGGGAGASASVTRTNTTVTTLGSAPCK